jgi:alkylation response protein AidB-like acyl-CoA dehydrogenase
LHGPIACPTRIVAPGMDLDFDEQHAILRQSVRGFALAHIAPNAQRWDSEERFPTELVAGLASMGLLGIRIPEEYGGSGMGMLAYAICIEELARVDGSAALSVASHNGLGTGHVLRFGTAEQKRRYLPKASSGE